MFYRFPKQRSRGKSLVPNKWCAYPKRGVLIKNGIIFSFLFLITVLCQAQDAYTEEQRLKGFTDYKINNREFQEQRVSDVEQIKKEKRKWDEQYKKDSEEYKKWKKGVGKIPDESSDEYKQDLAARIQNLKDKKEEQKAYARERDQLKAKKKKNISLTEEEELDLIEPKGKRAEASKRSLYTGKNIYGSKRPSSGGSGGFSGGNSFNPNPSDSSPMEMAPPPPPPPAADFYDAEPNPNASEPIFEEAPPPPPPMFEDSDF